MSSIQTLIKLLGIALCDLPAEKLPEDTDWEELRLLASKLEVPAIAMDGLLTCLDAYPEMETDACRAAKIEWFKSNVSLEVMNGVIEDTAGKLSDLYLKNGIHTWVLKGLAYSRRYPQPEHRMISDLDIYLGADYERGNCIIEKRGAKVDRSEYKHSKFRIGKASIENHQFFTAVRGNEANRRIERRLRELLGAQDATTLEGHDGLHLPSTAFDALFFLYHSRAHLLTVDGISMRFVTDWMMLRKNPSVASPDFRKECEDLGFAKFLRVIDELADCVENATEVSELSYEARYLLDSMSSRRLRKHDRALNIKIDIIRRFLSEGKKFRLYSDISSARMLWIYICGFLFDRHPEC